MNDKIYWVWLSRLFSCGSDKPNEILFRYDNPKDFYNLEKQQMLELGFLSMQEVQAIKATSLESSKLIIEDCEKLGINIVTMDDEDYPIRLRYIYGPPVVLYVLGNIKGINDELVISVVGTRNPSEYGEYVATRISGELASAGAVIVSGCAVGIDTAAHSGAIKAEKRTIAVLGCGLDVNYPAPNAKLKRVILKKGALISELPPKTQVQSNIFPIRNRIISGLSDGVIVVEAPTRSGSLITAEHAIEQGKDLFCVPPTNIYSNKFMGVARYIRDGAIPIMSSQDVLLEYNSKYADKLDATKIMGEYQLNAKKQAVLQDKKENSNSNIKTSDKPEMSNNTQDDRIKEIISELDEIQLKVYNVLSVKPKYIDEIVSDSGLNMNQVLAISTELEIMGIIGSYSGRRYGLLS